MLLWLTYASRKDSDVQCGLSVDLETLIQTPRTECQRTPTVEHLARFTHGALNHIDCGKR